MTHPAVDLTRAFYAFENPGRGADMYEGPVTLEPEFMPIPGKHPEDLLTRAGEAVLEERVCMRLSTSSEYKGDPRLTEGFLGALGTLSSPLVFECVRIEGETEVLVGVSPEDSLFLDILAGGAPGLSLEPDQGLFSRVDEIPEESSWSCRGFALAREWMLPLREAPVLSRLLTLCQALGRGEGLVFQALISPTRLPWQDAAKAALLTHRGEPFFADAPDFLRETRGKLDGPLLAVSLRLFAYAGSEERLAAILAPALGILCASGAENSLVPVAVDPSDEIRGLLSGTSFRTGMLLSPREVVGFIHVPANALEARQGVPAALTSGEVEIGHLAGTEGLEGVHLPLPARLRHTHLIGASGTGKSTLLLRMIREDIARGHGLALIDPHGDLADAVLATLPEGEERRLLVFDPSDPEYVLGFNPLEAGSEREREILASDLVAVFRRLSTSWGDQMTAVLSYAVLAILQGPGGNLGDLRLFLADPSFRSEYLRRVSDEFVREFFERDFKHLKGRPEAPILTRLNTLLRLPLLREVFLSEGAPLDLAEVVEKRQILVCRLSKGAIGAENAALLASLLVTKLHQAAFMRENLPTSERHPFFVYIDEVHECLSPSLAEIFSGARKFGLAITVAHQSLSQLEARERETLKALLANAYTRIIFRVGEEDARVLARSTGGVSADELVDLETGEAVVRSGRARDTARIQTLFFPSPGEAERRRGQALRHQALARYASKRREREERVEKLPVEKPPVERMERRETSPPKVESKAPGHGGAEHRYLQGLVSEWGRSRGFEVRLEEVVPEISGRVDVGLHKESRSIAVEIAVTTDVRHERGKPPKLLRAGFSEVVVVSTNEPLLKRLAEEFAGEERIHLLSPQELFGFLRSEPEEKGVVAGYKVAVKESEGKGRRSALSDVLARNLRRLKEKR